MITTSTFGLLPDEDTLEAMKKGYAVFFINGGVLIVVGFMI